MNRILAAFLYAMHHFPLAIVAILVGFAMWWALRPQSKREQAARKALAARIALMEKAQHEEMLEKAVHEKTTDLQEEVKRLRAKYEDPVVVVLDTYRGGSPEQEIALLQQANDEADTKLLRLKQEKAQLLKRLAATRGESHLRRLK